MNRTRAEHLQWAKDRAIQQLESDGSIAGAFASITSDLTKHPETQEHVGIELGAMLIFGGNITTIEQMKEWINGFN